MGDDSNGDISDSSGDAWIVDSGRGGLDSGSVMVKEVIVVVVVTV